MDDCLILYNKYLDELHSNSFKNVHFIKYEDLNNELSIVFNKLGIDFDGKLKIFKKNSNNRKHYKNRI